MQFIPVNLPIIDEALEINSAEIPTDYKEYKATTLGFIIDISLQHHTDTRRYIDIIKDEIIKVLLTMEDEDRLYVYSTENDRVFDKALAIHKIKEYFAPLSFNALESMRLTLRLIGSQDHCKYIFYIANREPKHNLELALQQKNGCEVVIIGVDRYYANLKDFLYLKDPYSLSKTILEYLKKDKDGKGI